mgnify:CR=1 FL=1
MFGLGDFWFKEVIYIGISRFQTTFGIEGIPMEWVSGFEGFFCNYTTINYTFGFQKSYLMTLTLK